MGRNRKNLYDKENLLTLLTPYKANLTSVKAWNEFSKQHNLPHSATLIKNFGSWNQVKEALSLDQSKAQRPVKYSAEELLILLDRYHEKFTTINDWNAFASENELPSYPTFERYLGREEIERKTGLVLNWDEKKLKSVIKEHFPDKAPTISQWNAIAKEYSLPTHMTIVRHFNSWSIMKARVYHS